MSPDSSRIDSLLAYALLIAGEADDRFDRELGPIHLIKYVYLADLAYSLRNNGQTYTGVQWQFYKFGPWSQTVNARIEPALKRFGAEQKTFSSEYGKDDWSRWSLTNQQLLSELEREITPQIQLKLRPLIKSYGKDTAGLLDHVYRTTPMLNAAPNEYLNFGLEENAKANVTLAVSAPAVDLSEKKKKLLKAKFERVRAELKSRKATAALLVDPVTNRAYDQVYEQGLAWLESLAGEPLEPGEKVVEFSPEVWKSPTRKGTDVS